MLLSEFLKAKCLMNCEVSLILEHKYDQLKNMADDPMNQVSQWVIFVTWISIVVMDFLWLIMLFAEYLRNHCSMWNVSAATKIPMPLDKRESILKCFFYIVFPSKILLSVYIGQALTQNQNLEQISVDWIRGNDPTNLLVCSQNVVPKY